MCLYLIKGKILNSVFSTFFPHVFIKIKCNVIYTKHTYLKHASQLLFLRYVYTHVTTTQVKI